MQVEKYSVEPVEERQSNVDPMIGMAKVLCTSDTLDVPPDKRAEACRNYYEMKALEDEQRAILNRACAKKPDLDWCN